MNSITKKHHNCACLLSLKFKGGLNKYWLLIQTLLKHPLKRNFKFIRLENKAITTIIYHCTIIKIYISTRDVAFLFIALFFLNVPKNMFTH